ncbi:hypothetical protein [Methylobacterium currus]|uniref:hypothetical protein n=1 Tax=Methylobacterium currus TaxID=2051553 RepID=UPI0013DECE31|nr:hypothetical protein [Methylobacterium currus]
MRALLALLALCGSAAAADMTPFYRMQSDPYLLPSTTAPAQYPIPQPVGATSYRIVNPCQVDIRLKTVATTSSQVTASTGTRILARTVEVLASSPSLSNPRIVSIMTMADPGAAGCTVEFTYGSGQ